MRGAAFEPAGPRCDSPGTAPSPRMTDASCPSAPRTACPVARGATPPAGLSAVNQSAAAATPLAEPPACIAGLTPGHQCLAVQVCRRDTLRGPLARHRRTHAVAPISSRVGLPEIVRVALRSLPPSGIRPGANECQTL